MKQITEDYCNFEISKLLKEKGFEQDYYNYPVYWMNGNNLTLSFEGDDDFPYNQNECVSPSKWAAMKWLRECKSLNIEIKVHSIVFGNEPVSWNFAIYDSANNMDYRTNVTYDTYEEACEVAIKYCLKNLIL